MYKYTVSAFVPEFFLKLCRNTMMQMSAILFKHTKFYCDNKQDRPMEDITVSFY